MKNFSKILVCVSGLVFASCDLQPKIASLPDSVGDFISSRYPALLADPDSQPEIYNSAATDYGVYASPELYGSVNEDDYVLYSSVSDYIIPPQAENTESVEDASTDNDTATVGAESKATTASVEQETSKTEPGADNKKTAESADTPAKKTETQNTDDVLSVPLYGSLELTSDTQINTVTVIKGDTLYSIAKKYNMKADELARINQMSAPYNLKIGQVLRLTDDTASVVKPAAETKNETSKSTPVAKPEPEKSVPAPVNATPAKTQQVVIKNPTPTTTRVELQEITVAPGDTLYSVSRRYSVPVNDLAVMNNISAPFNLQVGQRIKVPNLASPTVHVATSVVPNAAPKSGTAPDAETLVVKTAVPVATVTKAEKSSEIHKAKSEKKNASDVAKTEKGKSVTKKDTVAADGGAPKNVKSSLYGGPDKQNAKVNAPAKTAKTDVKANKNTKTSESGKITESKNNKTAKTTPENVAKKENKTKISSDPNKALPKIAARSSSKFSWPVRGKVLSHFGAKSAGLFNDGINISATRGTTVKAAENGVVAYAGNEVKGMGDLVIIQHADGWMTVYAHMDSMAVRRGAKVTVGQKIGTVGATGRVDRPQLHFEIRKGTKAYNPMKYLKQ